MNKDTFQRNIFHKLFGQRRNMPKKTCKSCQREKPLEAFYKSKGHKDGRNSRCKQCLKSKDAPKKEGKNKQKYANNHGVWKKRPQIYPTYDFNSLR